MRISTNTIFESGSARLSELQSSLLKTQQQISANRRLLTPADDPIAAARALEITQSQSLNTQYATNRKSATSALSLEESSLQSVTSLIQDVQTQVVEAGNAGYDDVQRKYIATDLRGRLDELISLANTRDSEGNYQFSGFQTSTQPFSSSASASGVQYSGDQGQRLLQVGTSRQMAISDSGDGVFEKVASSTGGTQSVFKTLDNLIKLLETPATTPDDKKNLTAGLATASTNMSNALDNVLTVRASVGSRLKELETLDSAGTDRDIQYSDQLSQLQDLDYYKAASDLTMQKTTLEAAQQSFIKITGLSLFNFL